MFSDARGKGRYTGENFFNDGYVKSRLRNPLPKIGKDVIIHIVEGDARKLANHDGTGVPTKRHSRNVLAMLSGLRSGELHALTWGDVALDGKVPTVRVERQLTRNGGPGEPPAFKPPKCNSKRTVPLHPFAVAALQKWKAETQFPGAQHPVFPSLDGRYHNDFNTRDLTLDLLTTAATRGLRGSTSSRPTRCGEPASRCSLVPMSLTAT